MVKCTCHQFRENKSLFYDAVQDGRLKLLSETNANYEQKAELECTQCGKKWLFTRDDSYHHPVVEWREL